MSLIVLRALTCVNLECTWFSRDGFLLNFHNADLRLLIAVLHSSLNHGLRLFELVEDFVSPAKQKRDICIAFRRRCRRRRRRKFFLCFGHFLRNYKG